MEQDRAHCGRFRWQVDYAASDSIDGPHGRGGGEHFGTFGGRGNELAIGADGDVFNRRGRGAERGAKPRRCRQGLEVKRADLPVTVPYRNRCTLLVHGNG